MLNQTPYCASGARHLLEHGGASRELIDQLGGDEAGGDAAGGDEAGGDEADGRTGDARLDEILRYTTILTRSPAEVTEQDIEALRAVGAVGCRYCRGEQPGGLLRLLRAVQGPGPFRLLRGPGR